MINRYALLLFTLLLLGCKDFDVEWERPNYDGQHYSNLSVVGLSHELDARRFYEQTAVAELKKHGISSSEGLKVFPQWLTEKKNNQEGITERIIRHTIDAVLVIKILHYSDAEAMQVNDYVKFLKYYSANKKYHTYTPGYYERPEKYIMIANLFDLKEKHVENDETLVWRASQLIVNPSNNTPKKVAFIEDVVEHLVDKGLIR